MSARAGEIVRMRSQTDAPRRQTWLSDCKFVGQSSLFGLCRFFAHPAPKKVQIYKNRREPELFWSVGAK